MLIVGTIIFSMKKFKNLLTIKHICAIISITKQEWCYRLAILEEGEEFMIFKRKVYGIEEEIDATVGSTQVKYKIIKKGCRQNTYKVEFDNGIPFIKRYGKKAFSFFR